MSRRANSDLDPVDVKCEACGSVYVAFRHYVEPEPRKPDPCKICSADFIRPDDGWRTNSWTGQTYRNHFRIEYRIFRLKVRGRPKEPGEATAAHD
jgi:hypothetical protein